MNVLVSKDLMFASSVSSAVKASGGQLALVSTGNRALNKVTQGGVRCVIIDLDLWSSDLAHHVMLLKKQNETVRVIAYGPHVDEERLSEAAAGCDLVLTRGEFHQRMNELLGE